MLATQEKMADMAKHRRLDNEWKMTARTVLAVWDAMCDSVGRMHRAGRVRFRGRRVGKEAYINAAVMWLNEQDAATQEEVLATYLPRLESLLVAAPAPQQKAASRDTSPRITGPGVTPLPPSKGKGGKEPA